MLLNCNWRFCLNLPVFKACITYLWQMKKNLSFYKTWLMIWKIIFIFSFASVLRIWFVLLSCPKLIKVQRHKFFFVIILLKFSQNVCWSQLSPSAAHFYPYVHCEICTIENQKIKLVKIVNVVKVGVFMRSVILS